MGAPLIDEIYKKLYPLTQADEAKKMEHIENIKKRYKAPAFSLLDQNGTIHTLEEYEGKKM